MAASISIAGPDDAEELTTALQGLVPQLSRSNPPPPLAAVQAMLAHQAITQFVARDDSGAIVGVSTLAVFPIPTGQRAWVEDVIVDEASGGQGIGQRLTEAMLTRARELGCVTVDLTSRPSREAANRLYARVGFERRETNVYRKVIGNTEDDPS
ncbi:GNAT family N-acetyltransferase [uncultured Arthrobacter sp.]|uniref:GNAT family N-acetyltransferase n=1 Tax=uncultured Arthrobacter sp. TaxID=114050 RepID=UPI003217E5BB